MQYKNLNTKRGGLWSISFFILAISMFSCSETYVRNKEAREDEQEYQAAVNAQSKIPHQLESKVETDVVMAHEDDDSADDPAIWSHDTHPEKSVVFGSNKIAGIHSFDMQGKQIQYIPCGKINNVDVRKDVMWDGQKVDILAGSNRSNNTIAVFIIDPNGKINTTPDYSVNLGRFAPYGFCLYKGNNDQLYAYVNGKYGDIFQVRLNLKKGQFKSKLVRRLKVNRQVEGMVADDEAHIIYIGEEEYAIHVFGAKETDGLKGKILSGSTRKNPMIRYDIEGLALLPPHYLIASSQGNFSYAIFDLKKDKYITSFTLKDGACDSVEETDGIDLVKGDFGPLFPEGLFVVQDGFNFDGSIKKSQNFKYVDVRDIDTLLK